MKLFRAHSKLKIYYEWRHRYSNVVVVWARDGDLLPDRFNGKYIKDYEPGCIGEQTISELFTAEEAVRLQQWLLSSNEEVCTIEEVALPITEDILYLDYHYEEQDAMCAILTLPGLPTTRVAGYAENIFYENRVPVSHDFVIGSAYNINSKCFYCNKEINDETHYRVLAVLDLDSDKRGYWWIYNSLCDDCSLAHAPELYLTLKALGMPERDPAYLPGKGIKQSFGIKFSSESLQDNEPCPICGRTTPLCFPFSIIGLNGNEVERRRLCEKCAEIHVPHLLQIVKHFYASGADKNFLKRYEQERTSMEYGIFKNKILDEQD